MSQPTPPNKIPNLILTQSEFDSFNDTVTKCYPFVTRQAQNEFEETKNYIEVIPSPPEVFNLVNVAVCNEASFSDSGISPNEYQAANFSVAASSLRSWVIICKFVNPLSGAEIYKNLNSTEYEVLDVVVTDNANYSGFFNGLNNTVLIVQNNTGVTPGTQIRLDIRPIGAVSTFNVYINIS